MCDSQGNSVISLLIERLPSVALNALDQFHLKDRINRKQFFYLNCLEPHQEDDGPTRAKTALEVILSLTNVILNPDIIIELGHKTDIILLQTLYFFSRIC